MTAVTFDTFEVIRNLQEAGLQEPAAKAVVDTIKNSFDDSVATKADIAELKGDIARLEARLESEIAKVELRLLIKLGLMQVATVGAIAAIIGIWG